MYNILYTYKRDAEFPWAVRAYVYTYIILLLRYAVAVRRVAPFIYICPSDTCVYARTTKT